MNVLLSNTSRIRLVDRQRFPEDGQISIQEMVTQLLVIVDVFTFWKPTGVCRDFVSLGIKNNLSNSLG
jgi:hypothetical protein